MITPLVIIDMQNYFFKRNRSQFEEIIKRVKQTADMCKLWIKMKQPIVFVEYDLSDGYVENKGDERTHEIIRDVTKHYRNKHIVKKCDDGGHHDIEKMLIHKKIMTSDIFACGVNLSYCVKDTVFGLNHWYNYNIKVIHDVTFNVCEIGGGKDVTDRRCNELKIENAINIVRASEIKI